MKLRHQSTHLHDDEGNFGRRRPIHGPVTGKFSLMDESGFVTVDDDDAPTMIASGGWVSAEPPPPPPKRKLKKDDLDEDGKGTSRRS